ncbi:hypothetical protein CER21_27815 [Klebsiella pneumoniae subsp. pneumoniae]|nr:hypothetical protein CER21_27815 [Klebsiella pneumoniae subsp. pneumoniae]
MSATRAWLTAFVLSAILDWIQMALWSLLRGLGTGPGGPGLQARPPGGQVLVLMSVKVPSRFGGFVFTRVNIGSAWTIAVNLAGLLMLTPGKGRPWRAR